jgi:hypothetical protein
MHMLANASAARVNDSHLSDLLHCDMDAMQTEFVGAGFMIGSACAVVLPEGFEVLYSTAVPTVHEHMPDSSLLDVTAHPEEGSLESRNSHHHSHDSDHSHTSQTLPFPRWAPGATLLAGFLAMMLFEFVHHQIEGGSHGHVHSHVHSQAHMNNKVRPVM